MAAVYQQGPAARNFETFAHKSASALAVAEHYSGMATHFVMDNEDESSREAVEALGYRVLVTETLMATEKHKIDLAAAVCNMIGLSSNLYGSLRNFHGSFRNSHGRPREASGRFQTSSRNFRKAASSFQNFQ